MAGFQVTPAALEAVSGTLRALASRMDEARARTRGLAAGEFGDPRLTAATDRFTDHWSSQTERVGTSLEEAADRLRRAAAGYQDVEDAQVRAQGSGAGG